MLSKYNLDSHLEILFMLEPLPISFTLHISVSEISHFIQGTMHITNHNIFSVGQTVCLYVVIFGSNDPIQCLTLSE